MSGFKCEICGGKIIMQANKAGLCQACGMEYNIEAIRAMARHKDSLSDELNVIASYKSQKDEIDRETLLVYLNDIRIMETIISKSNNTLTVFEDNITNLTDEIEELQSKIPEKPKDPKCQTEIAICESLKKKYAIFFPLSIVGIVCFFTFFGLVFATYNSTKYFYLLLSFLSIICFVYTTLKTPKPNPYRRIEQLQFQEMKYNSDKNDYYSKYENQLNEIKIMINNAEKKLNEFDEVKPAIDEEIADTKQSLDKAYSANIIPMPFRNIEGAYYLYDYLSTSNQSLSEALMQANLEAIKQKLDKIILLQSEEIIKQAQANAKLGSIIEISEDIRNNSAVAAKYSQIIATNSELNAKLAAKQLAYQRAEFWLN